MFYTRLCSTGQPQPLWRLRSRFNHEPLRGVTVSFFSLPLLNLVSLPCNKTTSSQFIIIKWSYENSVLKNSRYGDQRSFHKNQNVAPKWRPFSSSPVISSPIPMMRIHRPSSSKVHVVVHVCSTRSAAVASFLSFTQENCHNPLF